MIRNSDTSLHLAIHRQNSSASALPRFLRSAYNSGLFLVLALMSGCRTGPVSTSEHNGQGFAADRPEMHAATAAIEESSEAAFPEPTGDLTLRGAFAAALLGHPKLMGYEWNIRVREARMLDAGLLPNPEIQFEIEQFSGSGAFSGFDALETTVLYSQLIERGQKRQKRVNSAQLDQELAVWDYEAARVSILADVSRTFVHMLSLQERERMVQENLTLATEVYDAIDKRVKAGASSSLETANAEVEVAKVNIRLRRIQRQLRSARFQLAALWGSRAPRFDRVRGDFSALPDLPTIEALSERIAQNPEVARWAAEITRRQAEVAYQQAQAVSDVAVGLGLRHARDSNDVALVFNIAIPLTVFNRNQGGVQQAQNELEAARHLQREAELLINTSLSNSYHDLESTFEEIKALESELLPAVERAYAGTHTAYLEGKVGYLQVLDAQQAVFDARSRHFEALANYHAVAVEIEGLIGQPLSEVE